MLPTLPHIADRVTAAAATWPVRPRIVIGEAEKHAAFRNARAALAASGTVTLELALAQVPTIAAYRIPLWEGLVFRMMAHIDTVILANLVLGEKAIPEFLQRRLHAGQARAALVPLLSDTPERQRQLDAFPSRHRHGPGRRASSARAARAILAGIAVPKPPYHRLPDHVNRRAQIDGTWPNIQRECRL